MFFPNGIYVFRGKGGERKGVECEGSWVEEPWSKRKLWQVRQRVRTRKVGEGGGQEKHMPRRQRKEQRTESLLVRRIMIQHRNVRSTVAFLLSTFFLGEEKRRELKKVKSTVLTGESECITHLELFVAHKVF